MDCAVKVKHMEEQHKKNKKKLINNGHSHISYCSSSLRDQTLLLVKFIFFFSEKQF
jgi:hypothetical protein